MRVKEMQEALRKKGIDTALLIGDDPNIFYFTQMQYLNFSVLLIPKEGSPVLMVPKMDYERARHQSRIRRIVCFEKKKLISDFIAYYLKRKKTRKIGINRSHMTLQNFLRLKTRVKGSFADISDELLLLRSVKTDQEITCIKKACEIASDGLRSVLSDFRFKTESEVEAAFDYFIKKKGGEPAFRTIVASGINSSYPHHATQADRLKKGFCLIDCGVKYKGYCSDITRTVFLGTPGKKDKEYYNMMLAVQERTISKLAPGIECSKIDSSCRDMLGYYSKLFIHSLGHGVGVEIHERPSLNKESKEVLKKDMILTVEPGIYIKGRFGIRIEDSVLIKEKPVCLTKVDKGFLSIRI